MAEQGKGNGERISQVLIVLITAVIGPVVVWIVTNPSSPINSQKVTPPAITAGLPSGQTVATVSQVEATVASALIPTETPAAVEPTPVVKDGLKLAISASDVRLDGDFLSVQVHLTNQLTTAQTISFAPEAISIKDNTGKNYQAVYGDGKGACKKPDLGKKKQLQIEAGKEAILSPLGVDQVNAWCTEGQDTVLPFYAGPISQNITYLIITIDELGPFQGQSFKIGL